MKSFNCHLIEFYQQQALSHFFVLLVVLFGPIAHTQQVEIRFYGWEGPWHSSHPAILLNPPKVDFLILTLVTHHSHCLL